MASMVTWDQGKDEWGPNSFNKGCSMLDLGDMELDCIENPDVGYQSCKYHCFDDQCNMGSMPELPPVTTDPTSPETSPTQPTTQSTIPSVEPPVDDHEVTCFINILLLFITFILI